tara:strand:- start:114 stop:470 length:357 start_codon:yes stop_codon:yes gene_type:complete
MSDEFDLGDAGVEALALSKRVSELEAENSRIKQVIKDNDLEDELEGLDCTSLEEKICMDGIRHIASLVEAQDYDQNDIKNFDTLYRTLRSIRGKVSSATKKTKVTDIKTLLKIAESTK